jgi:hypothetical protein
MGENKTRTGGWTFCYQSRWPSTTESIRAPCHGSYIEAVAARGDDYPSAGVRGCRDGRTTHTHTSTETVWLCVVLCAGDTDGFFYDGGPASFSIPTY